MPHRDAVSQLSGARVEYIHLIVVAPRHPEFLSVGCDVSHVGTAAAGNWPIRHDLVCDWIENADRTRTAATSGDRIPATVRHIQLGPIATRVESMGADSGVDETDFRQLHGIDDENTIFFHVCDVEGAAVCRGSDVLRHRGDIHESLHRRVALALAVKESLDLPRDVMGPHTGIESHI